MREHREVPAIDVSSLPTVVFGHRSPMWMGNLGFMAIEGSMFLMVLVSYFYYRTRVNDWPPEQVSPGLTWGTINLAVFILSLVPNIWLKRQAIAGRKQLVVFGFLVIIAVGLANIVLRVFEFPALNCKWDENAYASTVWMLISLHSLHLCTQWVENVFLLCTLGAGHDEGHRFVDVEQAVNYWYFVVLFEIAMYLTIYIAPRGL